MALLLLARHILLASMGHTLYATNIANNKNDRNCSKQMTLSYVQSVQSWSEVLWGTIGKYATLEHMPESTRNEEEVGGSLNADYTVSVRALILAWGACLTHRGRESMPRQARGLHVSSKRAGPSMSRQGLCRTCNACICSICLLGAGSIFSGTM